MRKFVLLFCWILFTTGCAPQLYRPEIAIVIPPTETAEPTPTSSPTGPPTATSVPPTATLTPLLTPTATPTTLPSTPTPPPPTATPTPATSSASLAFVGDIMLARRLGEQIEAGNLDYPFEEVDEILRSADYTVGNLETALGSGGTPAAKAYPFISPPQSAELLANVGFDLLSLANNHSLDYGAESLREGVRLLNASGVETIGAGQSSAEAYAPHTAIVNGVRVGFLAYVNVPVEWRGFDTESWTATATEAGLAWGTAERVSADVATLAPYADHVVVLLHSGYEYQEHPSPIQRDLAHAAVNAGASLVVGHHTHILQGVEQTERGTIVYGLGDFAFDMNETGRSAILHVTLTKDAIADLTFTPVLTQIDGKPVLPTTKQAAAIHDLIDEMSTRIPPFD